MTRYEVVFAKSSSHVIDSLGNPCRYRTRDGQSLAPGYYMVIWPDNSQEPLFDADAQYKGPFPSPEAAQSWACGSMLRDDDRRLRLAVASQEQ